MIRLTIGTSGHDDRAELVLSRTRTTLRFVPKLDKLYLVCLQTFTFPADMKQEEPNGLKLGDEDADGWRSISYRRGRFFAQFIVGKREPWIVAASRRPDERRAEA